MTPPTDAERSAVYAAELAAFDGTDLEVRREIGVLAAVAARVTTGRPAASDAFAGWWSGPTVVIRAARRDSTRSSTHGGVATMHPDRRGRATIRLADAQRTLATLAHELAHALAGADQGHGPIFRAAYLDVVAVVTNLDPTDRRGSLHTDQLRTAFTDAGLSVGERRWAAPPAEAIGAIVLGP